MPLAQKVFCWKLMKTLKAINVLMQYYIYSITSINYNKLENFPHPEATSNGISIYRGLFENYLKYIKKNTQQPMPTLIGYERTM